MNLANKISIPFTEAEFFQALSLVQISIKIDGGKFIRYHKEEIASMYYDKSPLMEMTGIVLITFTKSVFYSQIDLRGSALASFFDDFIPNLLGFTTQEEVIHWLDEVMRP